MTTLLPDDAHDRALREVAEWLRLYAKSELKTVEGMKPSSIAEAVALICNNLADRFERDIGQLSVALANAEQGVIAAARTENLVAIREATAVLGMTQALIDTTRRMGAIRRLTDPPDPTRST